MGQTIDKREQDKFFRAMIVITIVFIAFNLRPSITSVGPLIGVIRDDVGLSNWSVALLTSLPLIAFAIVSPLAPRLASRLSNEWAIAIGLFALIVGIGIRSIPIILFIFLGTFLLGAGIAICNVLLPAFIKEKYPEKIGLMTSIYTTAMSLIATIATALSVPLLESFAFNWQIPLLIWIIPAIAGLFVCIVLIWQEKGYHDEKKNIKSSSQRAIQVRNRAIWHSPLAWKIALFMGFQSIIFYTMISWLPEMLIDSGLNRISAGFMLSYFQLIGLPVSFIVPIIAMRMESQRLLVLVVNGLYLISFTTLLFNPPFLIVVLVVTLVGISQSANFALTFIFFSVRAENPRDAADLSAMAQTVGYVLAATAPILIGFIYDLTNAWTIPIIMLLVFALIIIYMGMSAGRKAYV